MKRRHDKAHEKSGDNDEKVDKKFWSGKSHRFLLHFRYLIELEQVVAVSRNKACRCNEEGERTFGVGVRALWRPAGRSSYWIAIDCGPIEVTACDNT